MSCHVCGFLSSRGTAAQGAADSASGQTGLPVQSPAETKELIVTGLPLVGTRQPVSGSSGKPPKKAPTEAANMPPAVSPTDPGSGDCHAASGAVAIENMTAADQLLPGEGNPFLAEHGVDLFLQARSRASRIVLAARGVGNQFGFRSARHLLRHQPCSARRCSACSVRTEDISQSARGAHTCPAWPDMRP
jgi:hypothetical protein